MKKSIVYHILFWILLILSFAISEWNYRNTFSDAIIFELLGLPIRLIAVYINWFILIPIFLYSNRYYHYTFYLLITLSVLAILHRVFVLYYGYPVYFPEWIENQTIEVFRITNLVQIILIVLLPLALTTGWRLFFDLKAKQQQAKELEKEKADAELNYLKSQINPHFLFNTLNTIYGFSLENSKKTPELILKLSDFLSFSLYESNQKLIPLEKEIALMNDFIALEKTRFEDRVNVDFKLDIDDINSIFVPPLILVPFVENAFKHSLKNETEVAFVNIILKASVNQINFTVFNSKPSEFISSSVKNGLGLVNIKKRLNIIYGNQYQLEIKDEVKTHNINLLIKIE